MYIQITNDPEKPVFISRKLFKSMGFKGNAPWFIQIVRIKGTDNFAIVHRTNADTFKTQCTMVTKRKDNRYPALFLWTIPSLDYFLAITGLHIVTTKIIKVKKITNNDLTYYQICNK